MESNTGRYASSSVDYAASNGFDDPVSKAGRYLERWTPPKSKRNPGEHKPRPPNAFILFRTAFLKSQGRSESFRNPSHPDLSKMVGRTWQDLPSGERSKWEERANEEQLGTAHRSNFRDYEIVPQAKAPDRHRRVGRSEVDRSPSRQGERRREGLAALLRDGLEEEDLSTKHGDFGGPLASSRSSLEMEVETAPCFRCKRLGLECDGIKPVCLNCHRTGKSCSGRIHGDGDVSAPDVNSSSSTTDASAMRERGGVTYNISNTYYGTVNNVGNIEKAMFGDADGTLLVPHDAETPPQVPVRDPPTKVSCPPHSFIMFCSAMARARYSSESISLSDEEASDVVLKTWGSLCSEDRARIGEEAERSEEMHLAMLGSESMAVRGKMKKEKYWSFVGEMTDFWLQKWNQAQVAVKEHFRRLGKDLLLLSTDFTGASGAFQSPATSPTSKQAVKGVSTRLLGRVGRNREKVETASIPIVSIGLSG